MSNKYLPFILLALFVGILAFPSCRNNPKNEKVSGELTDTSRIYLENLNKKIAANNSDPGLYNLRAQFYMNDKRFDKALTDINKAINLAPDNPRFYITLSDIYLQTGEPQKCSDVLKKALAVSPDNNDVLVKMAKLSLIQRDYKSAFLTVKKALDKQPVNPNAYFVRAIAFLETGDTLKAVDDLKKTVDQDQRFFDAFVQLGDLYTLRKDNLAAEYYKAALRIRPSSKEVLYSLGMFYQESGQYDKAIDTYTLLAKTDTTFRNAPYNIGYIYLVYLHDFGQAANYFTMAIHRSPGYVDAWFNRGYSYELGGQLNKAYKDYQKVLELSTNYPKAIEALNRLDKMKTGK